VGQWTSQEDLKLVLNASQGEMPRVVLAPGTIEECYEYIQHAFNIAEKFQTPVIVVTDKYLGSSHKWVELKDLHDVSISRGEVVTDVDLKNKKEYLRYAQTDSGVSPRALPGTIGGVHLANTDEHNEKGFSEEDAEPRTQMMDKRFRKLASIAKTLPEPELIGDKNADLTLVSWGSTHGPIMEAMVELKKSGKSVNYLQIVYISPFPAEKVKAVFKHAKKVAIVENNKTGQFAGWLREQTGFSPDYKILKYDGRPFFTPELVEAIKDLK